MMIPPSNIRDLFDSREKIIIDLLNAAELQVNDDFDEQDYREEVKAEISRLKSCLEAIGSTLSFEALEFARSTETELLDVVRKIRHTKARDAALDEITDQFCLSTAYLDQWMATSPAVKLKIARQILAQSYEPAEVARKHVSEIDKAEFLHSFVQLAADLQRPGIKADEWQLAVFFAELGTYLTEQSRVEGAVEHIAANINVVGPLIGRLVEYTKDSKTDIQALIVKNKLSVDSEFLAGLYAATRHPQVKELGAIAALNPSGKTPFAFLETMDLGLTPEWFSARQGEAEGAYLLALINHALVTPGVELNLSQVANNCETWKVKGYLDAIKGAPVDQPDCAAKVNQLLGELAEQCRTHEKRRQIRQQIADSTLPVELLRPHLTLMGDRFTQELGV